MLAKKIDKQLAHQALRRLQIRIGGRIQGSKLYPLDDALRSLIQKPEINPTLSRRTYLLQTISGREERIAQAIRDRGLDFFLPVEPKSVRVNAITRKTVYRPMMPGYVLPIFDEFRDRWKEVFDDSRIRDLGIIRLFQMHERPIPIPYACVDRVKKREIELKMGGARKLPPLPFKVGDWVQIQEHLSFTGLMAQVMELRQDKNRLVVELDIFGQKVPVELSIDQVRVV